VLSQGSDVRINRKRADCEDRRENVHVCGTRERNEETRQSQTDQTAARDTLSYSGIEKLKETEDGGVRDGGKQKDERRPCMRASTPSDKRCEQGKKGIYTPVSSSVFVSQGSRWDCYNI